jgi:two-component system chemotaxis response regulator CheB
MPGHDIIVIGASAGGVEALETLARELPSDLDAALFIVLHLPPHSRSVLPLILSRAGPLCAVHPQDGEPIRPGRIYVASPDHHLLVRRGHVRLTHGPSENSYRPAIDPLFRSAAQAYGPRVIGVILSGSLDDGTAGLLTIKRRGGLAVVQDPDDALFAGMPQSAVENVQVDYVAPLAELPSLLARLSQQIVKEAGDRAMVNEIEEEEMETEIAEFDAGALKGDTRPGTPSVFSCPECHGTLWESREGEMVRFRCRVGHAYSADSLMAEQSEALESALWSAYRALKESAALSRRLTEQARERDQYFAIPRFAEQAQDAEERAELIRQILLRGEVGAGIDPADANDITEDTTSEMTDTGST